MGTDRTKDRRNDLERRPYYWPSNPSTEALAWLPQLKGIVAYLHRGDLHCGRRLNRQAGE